MATVTTGDMFPDRTLPNEHGKPFPLSSLRGKPAIIYFYPKDDTPGCTIEANDFSSLQADFAKAGVQVVGISVDSAESHEQFCKKYNISIPLLVDEGGALIDELGIGNPLSKKAKRTTFLLDANGNIVRVWQNVKAAGHAKQVLEAVSTSSAATA